MGLTYYELDMNNEIYWGPDPDPTKGGKSRNLNVPNVSHSGVEIESLINITPRWTLKSNYTRQKVYFGYNWQTTDALRRTTLDKWLSLNPSDMANVELTYNNREWGFSGMIAYHYVGSRFLLNDVFNEQPDLEASKWGDISFSQKFWMVWQNCILESGISVTANIPHRVPMLHTIRPHLTSNIIRHPAGRIFLV